ncbi:MAG: molybdate ABC transporter permease subunit [Aquificae bacterium]|nr:molybdate ABC transporter permease subunit [Aquificota bacterium]
MWQALKLSLELALVNTLTLLLVALVLAPLLAFGSFRGKTLLTLLITLPLVLPPTVLGFYLLMLFSPSSPVGAFFTALLGETLLFNFKGLLVASAVSALPLAVLPAAAAMEKVGRELLETAFVFGYGKLETYLKVVLPMSRRGFAVAALLVFSRTLGEFGVVLMVGGNVPGRTQTLALYVYDAVQAFEYGKAHLAALLLAALSLASGGLLLLLGGLRERGGLRIL